MIMNYKHIIFKFYFYYMCEFLAESFKLHR